MLTDKQKGLLRQLRADRDERIPTSLMVNGGLPLSFEDLAMLARRIRDRDPEALASGVKRVLGEVPKGSTTPRELALDLITVTLSVTPDFAEALIDAEPEELAAL